ncbi:hypothetical protein AB6809_28025 [Paraburkholderia sp. RCC_158]|uniref:hypothetical protein n=1 Tax=Paraburkholderia sp. RCC_158 TaxID=3239220 RepID=UPI003523B0AB
MAQTIVAFGRGALVGQFETFDTTRQIVNNCRTLSTTGLYGHSVEGKEYVVRQSEKNLIRQSPP